MSIQFTLFLISQKDDNVMCLMPFVVMVLLAAEPEIVAQEIRLKPAEFDSFTDVLRVIQRSGTVELSHASSAAAFIEVDMYSKGKKVEEPLKPLGSSDHTRKSDRVRFALNVVDMDYLTLGDGKKGHCRLL